ncbi:hypothetical protein [Desulfogranum japonicum]|uniref:hypothetical protein n=1 Tax=Desulfogranum japonicum TaxID=231447 RepID=UPI00041DE078|nr:hypothetical protein [Desulfogranum japonicum]
MDRWKDKNNMVMVNFYLPQESFEQLLSISEMLGYSRSHVLRTATMNELDRLATTYNERAEKRKEMMANIDRCIEQSEPMPGFGDDEDGEEWEW